MATVPTSDFLQTVPLLQCAHINPQGDAEAVWQSLAGLAHEIWYQKGDVIVLQGTRATDLFILQSGAAEAWKDDNMTVKFISGAHFGERELVHSGRASNEVQFRGATVVAIEPTKCLTFKHSDFDQMRELMPALTETVEEDKSKHKIVAQKRKQSVVILYNSFETFTHVKDTRARLLLDAMVDADVARTGTLPSTNDTCVSALSPASGLCARSYIALYTSNPRVCACLALTVLRMCVSCHARVLLPCTVPVL